MDAKALQRLASEVARRDLGENENTRDQFVQQFKEWLESNPDIRNYNTEDDKMALLYLRKGKFSIARAQEVFLKTQHFRNQFPHFMTRTDILDPTVGIHVKNGYVFGSPFTDDNGYHTVFVKLSKVDPNKCDYRETIRAQVGTTMSLMCKELAQVLGVVYVIDMEDITPSHVTHMPTTELLAYIKAVQQCIPMRFKAFHFINMPRAIKWFFDLIVSHATDKMKKRFMAHSSIEDLHKHVSPRVLPQEYGGEMPSKDMIDLWYKELLEARDTVLKWDTIRIVQPDNAGLKTSIAELPGTFRKLEVD